MRRARVRSADVAARVDRRFALAVVAPLFAALLANAARAQTNDAARVVEGPPDADVVLDGVERALEALTVGDAAWKEGKREAAFDAWRASIVASAGGTVVAPPPGTARDPDGALARRAEDGASPVRRRLAAIPVVDREAWSARFDALAEIERVAAGHAPAALARVQREFPRTRAAARSAIALADAARERGDETSAATWLERARIDADADLAAAIERRRAPARDERPTIALDFAARPALERVVEYGFARDERDAAIPGVALHVDGNRVTTWVHAHARLLAFDAEARAIAALDVLAATRSTASFSEPGAPWDDAFAFDGATIALVAGRARESLGNALVGVEAGSAPRVVWIRDERGLVRDGTPVADAEIAGARALVEFQPGPLLVGDTLVVHARAWPRAEEGATELDEARVESWCAGLDPRDGSLRWTRRLATGSTARGRDRGRATPAEPTASPAAPPVSASGRVAIDTGLGAVAVLDATDGRVAAIVRTARRGGRTPAIGGVVPADDGGAWWFAPAQPDGALLRLRGGADEDGEGSFLGAPLVLDGPRVPVAARGARWTAWAPASRGAALVEQDVESGREVRSAVLPHASGERGSVAAFAASNGWIASAAGAAYVLDASLRARAELELGPRSAYARLALAAAVDRSGRTIVRVVGLDRAAFVALRE